MLAQWIFQEKLPHVDYIRDMEPYIDFAYHLALHRLASQFEIRKLQNEILEQLRAMYVEMRSKKSIDIFTIRRVYRRKDQNSALRRFVWDAAAKDFLDGGKKERPGYAHLLTTLPAFSVQFTEALHDYNKSQRGYIKDCPERYMVDVEEAVATPESSVGVEGG